MGPRGRSASCGNGLFAQCVRLRSEINHTNVHIYDNKLAQDLIQRILNVYIPAFCQLRDGLMERYGELLLAPDDQFV